ncbi:MAG: hypothetical protein RCG15_03825 [Candidatus Rickettsia vulgarisii]
MTKFQIKTTTRLLKEKASIEYISQVTGLSVEKILKLYNILIISISYIIPSVIMATY